MGFGVWGLGFGVKCFGLRVRFGVSLCKVGSRRVLLVAATSSLQDEKSKKLKSLGRSVFPHRSKCIITHINIILESKRYRGKIHQGRVWEGLKKVVLGDKKGSTFWPMGVPVFPLVVLTCKSCLNSKSRSGDRSPVFKRLNSQAKRV